MKKNTKRIAAMAMAAALAMSMAMPIAAADGTITINGHTTQKLTGQFSAYQLLTLEKISADSWVYNINGKYRTLISEYISAKGQTPGADDATLLNQLMGFLNDGTTPADLEANARDFADAMYLAISTDTTGAYPADETTDKLENFQMSVNYGYWLVIQTDSDGAYSLAMLDSSNPNLCMTLKADTPTVEKKVYEEDLSNVDEGYGSGYNDIADYDINDEIPFSLFSRVPEMAGYDFYKMYFYDTVSAGLTFTAAHASSVTVTIGRYTLDAGEYDVELSPATGETFVVKIHDLAALVRDGKAAVDDQIRVDFTATLNDNAVIGLDGNTNHVYLAYTNDPYTTTDNDTGNDEPEGKTEEDTVLVFTFAGDIDKINAKNVSLDGAEFELYVQTGVDTDGAPVKEMVNLSYKADSDATASDPLGSDGIYDGYYFVDPNGTAVITSSSLYNIIIQGLDSGIYYLRETKAPQGYNLLTDDIEFSIEATYLADRQGWDAATMDADDALLVLTGIFNGSAAEDMLADGTIHGSVVNNGGPLLPGTGGIGVTIFYVVGFVLMVSAAGYFIVAKKRSR